MAYSAGLWYLIEQEKRENMNKNNITDYEDLYNEACEKYIPKILELGKDNKKLKAELENIKKRVKEHTTYSVKAEFIKKFWE